MPNVHQNIRQLFTEIANAIRFKTGGTAKIKADDFPTAINEIQVETIGTPSNQSGWLSDAAAIIGYMKGDLSGGYKHSEVALVKSYCFQNHYNLTKISFPACSTVQIGAFRNCSSLSWVSLEHTDKIQEYAFENCTSLQSITIPNCDLLNKFAFRNCSSLETVYASGVKSIYEECFANCTSLKTVTFPSCVYVGFNAFLSCYSLNIANFIAVTHISSSAFRYCSSLESVYFPNLTSINHAAFADCIGLKTVSVPTVTWLSKWAFYNCTGLEDIEIQNATTLKDHAFENCTSLQSVSLPKLKYIDSYAFINCTSLISCTFSPDLSIIYYNAFENCTALPSFSASMVTVLGNNCFKNCTSLSQVYFPRFSSVYNTSPVGYVFDGCTALKKVDFPAYNTPIRYYNHNNNISLESAWYSAASVIENHAFCSCYMLSDLRLANVISIYSYAFQECSSLSIINFPNCNYLSSGVFYKCIGLEQVNLGAIVSLYDNTFRECEKLSSFHASTLKLIGTSAFLNCYLLSDVHFPNVTTISAYAFQNCYSLSSITLSNVTSIQNNAFYHTNLEYISCQKLSIIHYSTFAECSMLSDVYFPNVSIMMAKAFMSTALKTVSSVNFPKLTRFSGATGNNYEAINYGYFAFCKDLEYVDLPTVTTISASNQWDNAFFASIGYGMFHGCDKLDYVYFASLSSISYYKNNNREFPVFAYGGFRKISLPKLSATHLNMFYGCSRLEEVYIPLWKTIPPSAFRKCENLSYAGNSYGLPSVTTIDQYAFAECSSLISVEFPLVTTVNSYAFNEAFVNVEDAELILSKQNLNIAYHGLYMAKAAHMTLGVSNFISQMWSEYYMGENRDVSPNARPFVKTLTLPYCITVSHNVMRHGNNLVSVSIPVAKTIGDGAFAYCWNLPSIDLPEVTNIGPWAFYQCSSLSDVSAPKVTTIGSYTFQQCSNLQRVEFPNVTNIGYFAFSDAFVNVEDAELILSKQNLNIAYHGLYMAKAAHMTLGVSNFISQMWSEYYMGENRDVSPNARPFVKTLTLPYCVTLGNEVMRHGNNLVSVSIPVAKTIGTAAFAFCWNLPSINLPEVTNIGPWAFFQCYSLSNVSALKLTNIGSSAFQQCSNLQRVEFPNVTSIGSYAFNQCSSLSYLSAPKVTTISSYAFSSCFKSETGAILTFGVSIFSHEPFHFYGTTYYSCGKGHVDNPKRYIKELYLSECTTIGNGALYDAEMLSILSAPKLTTIHAYGLEHTGLPKLSFSLVTHMSSGGCFLNTNASIADFPVLSTIPERAFEACSSLSSVSFPAATSVSANAFAGCTSLKEIELPEATSIYAAFQYSLQANPSSWDIELEVARFPKITYFSHTLWYSQTYYYQHPEKAPKKLKSIYLDNCTSIGNGAFYNCESLETVYAPKLQTIGTAAFERCGMSIISYSTVTTVDNYAFKSCNNLEEVNLPEAISIGNREVFNYALKLKKIWLPKWVKPSITFAYEYYNASNNSEGVLEEINFQFLNNVTYRSDIYDLPKLRKIHNLSNIVTFGEWFARNCFDLELDDDTFANTITISGNAFSGLSKLTSVYLPKIVNLKSYTFQWCKNLNTIKIEGPLSTDTFVTSNQFHGSPIMSLYLLTSGFMRGHYRSKTFENTFLNSTQFTDRDGVVHDSPTGGFGSIYVLSSMYNDYINNNDWSFYKDRFVPYP